MITTGGSPCFRWVRCMSLCGWPGDSCTIAPPQHAAHAVPLQPDVTYDDVGGAGDALEKLREVVELPLLHPERFLTLGIDPPKVRHRIMWYCPAPTLDMYRYPGYPVAVSCRDVCLVGRGRVCSCGAPLVRAKPCPPVPWPIVLTRPSSGSSVRTWLYAAACTCLCAPLMLVSKVAVVDPPLSLFQRAQAVNWCRSTSARGLAWCGTCSRWPGPNQPASFSSMR